MNDELAPSRLANDIPVVTLANVVAELLCG